MNSRLFVTAAAASLLSACAIQPAPAPLPPAIPPQVHAPPPQPPTPAFDERRRDEPTSVEITSRAQQVLLDDAREALGAAAFAEVMNAPTALLARSSFSLPKMVQQPDGSWKAPPPSVAAAIRTGGTWVRIARGGSHQPFEPAASIQLDRLTTSSSFWNEPPAETFCTDPSGMMLLARSGSRQYFGRYPCGFSGVTGRAAQLVLSGRIADWSAVDADLRPAGVPIARFDESVQAQYRFNNGIHDERLIAIRTPAEWDAQWRRIMMPTGRLPPLPAVDFTREMLIMAAMGRKPSGGYTATIDKVIDQAHERLAMVRFTSPGPRCGAIAALTSPLDIVRVPRSDREVRFHVERQVVDCP